ATAGAAGASPGPSVCPHSGDLELLPVAAQPGPPSTTASLPSAVPSRGQPPGLSPTPNALGLLQALRRRWLLALSCSLLAAGLGAGLTWWLLPPPKQSARTLLSVNSNRPVVLFPTHEPTPEFATYQKTQVALIKSRLVLNAALRQPGAAELSVIRQQRDPVAWLESELQVDYTLGPEVLRIALTGDRPDELAVLVNAVTDAY